jgi:hypothetical protein
MPRDSERDLVKPCISANFGKLGSCWRRILGITVRDSIVHESNRLHVDIFRFFFIKLRYILLIPLNWSVNVLKSLTSTDSYASSGRVSHSMNSVDFWLTDFQQTQYRQWNIRGPVDRERSTARKAPKPVWMHPICTKFESASGTKEKK